MLGSDKISSSTHHPSRLETVSKAMDPDFQAFDDLNMQYPLTDPARQLDAFALAQAPYPSGVPMAQAPYPSGVPMAYQGGAPGPPIHQGYPVYADQAYRLPPRPHGPPGHHVHPMPEHRSRFESKKNELDFKYTRKGYGEEARKQKSATLKSDQTAHLQHNVYDVFGLPRVRPVSEQPGHVTHAKSHDQEKARDDWRSYLARPEEVPEAAEDALDAYENDDRAQGPVSEALQEF